VFRPARKLQVGGVLGDAWYLYTRNSTTLILTAAVVYGLLAVVDALILSAIGGGVLLFAVSLAVTIVGVFWLQGTLVLLVEELRAGRVSPPIVRLFERVRPLLGKLIGAGILAAVGIGAGLVLGIVPGLVLLTLWSLITPAIVLEGSGVRSAFGRSMRLVRGNGFRAFAVIFVTVALATIVSVVIIAILAPLPDFFDVYIASVIANSVTVPFVALAWTVMYFELRSP